MKNEHIVTAQRTTGTKTRTFCQSKYVKLTFDVFQSWGTRAYYSESSCGFFSFNPTDRPNIRKRIRR